MWIRSKDRRLLINTDIVGVSMDFGRAHVNCFKDGETIDLGMYESINRAKEVLNMIQTRIIKGTTFDYINNSKKKQQKSLYFKCQRNKGDIW